MSNVIMESHLHHPSMATVMDHTDRLEQTCVSIRVGGQGGAQITYYGPDSLYALVELERCCREAQAMLIRRRQEVAP